MLRVLTAYAKAGLWPFFRALIRFLSVPLARVAEHMPEHGVIIDVGSGQGHFLLYCAHRGFRKLVGIEPSLDGLRRARAVLPDTVLLAQGRAQSLPISRCAAVTALDVMYLVDPAGQEVFLARVFELLEPGGVLLLKTMDPSRRLRQFVNTLQETLAVKVLGITLGGEFHFRRAEEWVTLCERSGFIAKAVPLWHGYLHPHLLIVAVRPR